MAALLPAKAIGALSPADKAYIFGKEYFPRLISAPLAQCTPPRSAEARFRFVQAGHPLGTGAHVGFIRNSIESTDFSRSGFREHLLVGRSSEVWPMPGKVGRDLF